jgi:hypothetical protein
MIIELFKVTAKEYIKKYGTMVTHYITEYEATELDFIDEQIDFWETWLFRIQNPDLNADSIRGGVNYFGTAKQIGDEMGFENFFSQTNRKIEFLKGKKSQVTENPPPPQGTGMKVKIPTPNKTERETETPLNLADLFDDVSKFKKVMELLVLEGLVHQNTYLWISHKGGYKGLLVGVIKKLQAQGYYRDNRMPTPEQIREISKNTFGVEVSVHTIKRAGIHDLYTKFIPPASTLPQE